jgi:hypothetical protein
MSLMLLNSMHDLDEKLAHTGIGIVSAIVLLRKQVRHRRSWRKFHEVGVKLGLGDS